MGRHCLIVLPNKNGEHKQTPPSVDKRQMCALVGWGVPNKPPRKGAQFEPTQREESQNESTEVDLTKNELRLYHRTSPRTCPPKPPWRPTPNPPNEGSRAQDDWRNRFRKLQTEQNLTNKTTNATKLVETR